MTSQVCAEVVDNVGWIRLRRPEKRNAINTAMWHDIAEALRSWAASAEVRALALTGDHGFFSAGADLREFATGSPEQKGEFVEAARTGLSLLRGFPRPTLAVIDGPCIGAGCSIALSCDVRLASTRAAFSIPAARHGVRYDEWSISRLVSLVGPGHTSRLLFSAAEVSGPAAQTLGLVEMCADDVAALAQSYLAEVGAGDPAAIDALRASVRRAAAPRI